MKKIVFSMLLLSAGACTKKENTAMVRGTDLSVILDITDSLNVKPEAGQFIETYNFMDDPGQAAEFTLLLITDVRLNKIVHIDLPDAVTSEKTNFADDEHYRDRKITGFCDSIKEVLSDFYTKDRVATTLPNSEVAATICKELVRSSKSRFDRKAVYVFSDLREHGSIFNGYTSEGLQLLKSDPARVAKIIARRCDLPRSLQGVTIHFRYQPRTSVESDLYFEWLAVYQILLGGKGANILVEANDKNYHL